MFVGKSLEKGEENETGVKEGETKCKLDGIIECDDGLSDGGRDKTVDNLLNDCDDKWLDGYKER